MGMGVKVEKVQYSFDSVRFDVPISIQFRLLDKINTEIRMKL